MDHDENDDDDNNSDDDDPSCLMGHDTSRYVMNS